MPTTTEDHALHTENNRRTSEHSHSPAKMEQAGAPSTGKGARFWILFASLNVTLFLSALELLAVSNALPTIAQDLKATEFAWVGSAYALSSTAFLPMTGALAEVFGRRPALMASIVLFFLGSGICGGASTMGMMIGGRTVQGLGSGGIQALSAIILADLVSLEERGLYAACFGLTWGIANFLGPIIGGALADAGAWRWLFYLNLPIAGIACVICFVVMKLPTPPGTFYEKIVKLDWIGNLLVVGSTAACTIALTWGGVVYPWNSARVVVPLVLGCVALVGFVVFETKGAKYPLIPWSVISNRTSVSGFLQTFLIGVVALGVVYFTPVYFQACHLASPMRSGVLILALAALAPAAMMASAMVRKTSRFRPQMWAGWILVLIGLGLMTTLTATTHVASAVGFLIILGVGVGQAPLPVSLNAPALSLHMFCRTFSGVWGVTIGSAVLQNELQRRLSRTLPEFFEANPGGVTIAYALIPSIRSMDDSLRSSVQTAFAESLKVLWEVLIGVAALGGLVSLLMRGLPLHSYTDEKWAVMEKSGGTSDKEVASRDN
ncbi:major facilitator superfamily domain-containing protein [Mucidula mucida]|nr:major facilitator superfamily domain-containing protein [Mucidula mucida]